METAEPWAYVIVSAYGNGNDDVEEYGDRRERAIGSTIPVVDALEWSFDADDNCHNWQGWLTRDQWETFRDDWCIDYDHCDQTLGMLVGPDGVRDDWWRPMWALSHTADGMDWNVGGRTCVDYVQVYFCCQDPDAMAAAGIEEEP